MKEDRFLWSAHRITERQKAGKARSIKGKQLKNSRSTVSRPRVALRSSPRDNLLAGSVKMVQRPRKIKIFRGLFLPQKVHLVKAWEKLQNRSFSHFTFRLILHLILVREEVRSWDK